MYVKMDMCVCACARRCPFFFIVILGFLLDGGFFNWAALLLFCFFLLSLVLFGIGGLTMIYDID